MDNLVFRGQVIAVGAVVTGESSRGTWHRQEFVVETVEQYPKKCVFNIFGNDKIEKFNVKKGEIVAVDFNIDAREYNGRWFNSIDAWRVTRGGQEVLQPAQTQAAPVQQPQQAPFPPQQGGGDDLPF